MFAITISKKKTTKKTTTKYQQRVQRAPLGIKFISLNQMKTVSVLLYVKHINSLISHSFAVVDMDQVLLGQFCCSHLAFTNDSLQYRLSDNQTVICSGGRMKKISLHCRMHPPPLFVQCYRYQRRQLFFLSSTTAFSKSECLNTFFFYCYIQNIYQQMLAMTLTKT